MDLGSIHNIEMEEIGHVMDWDNFYLTVGSKHPKHQNMSGKKGGEDG